MARVALVDGAQKICQEERAGDQSVCAAADQNGPRLLLLGVVTADADKLGVVVGVGLLSDGRIILCRVVLNEGLVITPPFGYWNGSRRVEYVCRGCHRNGKDDCTSHRIREEVLDKAVWDYTKQKEILRLGQKIDKLVMEKIQIQQ